MSNIKATEMSVNYNLPDNWSNESAYSFDHLSDLVLQLHNSAYTAAVKAVNRFATVRNYVIGFYIVEYKQHGSDRAKYGDQLLNRLAKKVNKREINETLLTNARNFYLLYPHINQVLLKLKHACAVSKILRLRIQIFGTYGKVVARLGTALH